MADDTAGPEPQPTAGPRVRGRLHLEGLRGAGRTVEHVPTADQPDRVVVRMGDAACYVELADEAAVVADLLAGASGDARRIAALLAESRR